MKAHTAALVVPAVLALSCSYKSLHGFAQPELAERIGRFVVMHRSGDGRDIDQFLVSLLHAHGREAKGEVESMESPDYVVEYVDRWYWDMRTYMIDFRVDVRDAETGVLLGTSRSFQTSLDAMGRTYQEIVQSALDVALWGPREKAEKSAQTTTSRRPKRRGR